jgi:CRP/FNR family cyclic AMP-dependent transcriptional regulator
MIEGPAQRWVLLPGPTRREARNDYDTRPFGRSSVPGGPTGPWLERLSYQGKRAVQHGGSRLFREGTPADRFWLIRDGRVSLEFRVSVRRDVVIEQLSPGTVLGWSYVFPPYRWHFTAITNEQILAIELDGRGVRRLCDDDPALGYELTRRLAAVLIDRLQAARMRLVHVYGYPAQQASWLSGRRPGLHRCDGGLVVDARCRAAFAARHASVSAIMGSCP